MSDAPLFVEVDCRQRHKASEHICGDAFASTRLGAEDRVITVLSDGLGSGVKANILSSMTATMALKFVAGNRDIVRASEVIMDSLPICRVRRISYATFSIIDSVLHGRTRMVEQGNPAALLIRAGQVYPLERRTLTTARWRDRELQVSEFETRPEDRLVVFSDGVSQAGLGNPQWKLGWRSEGCADFVRRTLRDEPEISARRLADAVVREAVAKEPGGVAHDDVSCAVLYFRRPRRLLLMTGPPFDAQRDREVAGRIDRFPGRRVVCGGTTSSIVGRELGRTIHMPLDAPRADLPPVCRMQGADLVTEGILTLTRAAQYLEAGPGPYPADAAGQLAELLHESDQIEFLVGTRINEAHQDPSLPVDLEIRRNIVKRIAQAMESRYLKETDIQCI
jgi:hypothetical protein